MNIWNLETVILKCNTYCWSDDVKIVLIVQKRVPRVLSGTVNPHLCPYQWCGGGGERQEARRSVFRGSKRRIVKRRIFQAPLASSFYSLQHKFFVRSGKNLTQKLKKCRFSYEKWNFWHKKTKNIGIFPKTSFNYQSKSLILHFSSIEILKAKNFVLFCKKVGVLRDQKRRREAAARGAFQCVSWGAKEARRIFDAPPHHWYTYTYTQLKIGSRQN